MNDTDALKGFKVLGLLNSYYAYNPEENPISGGEKRFFEVMRTWNRQGLNIEVLVSDMVHDTCLKHQLDVKYIILPLKIERIGVVGTYVFRAIMACIITPKFLGQVITYSATDIIPDIIPAVMVKVLNKNSKMVCVIFHLIPNYSVRAGSKVTNFVSYYSQRISHLFIRRFADIVFVDNTILRRDLIRRKFPQEKIKVISMGIDKAYIDSISPSSVERYDACFLGRLHVSKGIFDLIEIWKLVVSKNKSARLAIIYVGPSDLEYALMRRIKEENLDSNFFMLPLKGKDALSAVKSSEVFVFPSHEEGWGIAICEAMACGLPVVAYDLPVFREIFPKGMIRVKMRDYQAFAENILELLGNKVKCGRLREDAATMASQYSWDETAARELSYLRSVVRGEKK